jgi:hypothetical protein
MSAAWGEPSRPGFPSGGTGKGGVTSEIAKNENYLPLSCIATCAAHPRIPMGIERLQPQVESIRSCIMLNDFS